MTQDEIRNLFIYEPDTGMLRRRCNRLKPYPWRGAGADRRYLMTNIGAKHLYLHQAVFLYHYGHLPPRIDHRDRDTKNCRIENLRECTAAQNQYNSKRKKNNRSGVKGVVYHPSCPGKPWQAKIVVNKKTISLGYHRTVEDAAKAYAKAAAEYAGPFARPDSLHGVSS